MNNDISDISRLQEDFTDFFEHSLCGFVIAAPDGKIIRANRTLAGWLRCTPGDLTGKQMSELLAVGGRIYYETHLRPLLRMQGYFEEIALEMEYRDQPKMPVLLNAFERKNEHDEVLFIRFTILKATDRRIYENNLKELKANLEISLANALHVTTLREQFIAILGHDLRNPLGSIIAAGSYLEKNPLAEQKPQVVQIINRSANRMKELIEIIMDFARTRLGEGIIVNCQPVQLQPILEHVVDELCTIHPDCIVQTHYELREAVTCDGPRIAQLFSNLLANAIIHGFPKTIIRVNAFSRDGLFQLSVSNAGKKIAEEQMSRLFEPFTRESHSTSQNGLGLGLYIASQIAKAHKGELTASSTELETCFTLKIDDPNRER